MAPLYYEFLKLKHIDTKLCVTAQHREMLDQVLSFFEIVPDFDLDLMLPNQTLNSLSSKILIEIDKILVSEKPNLVLVHGDTTTSAIVSIAAFHRNIKVGHVEAGLRTFNKTSPFPEEMNRQITSRIADYHFAPTICAEKNLLNENINLNSILVTGNTVVDALLLAKKKIDSEYKNIQIEKLLRFISKKIVLVTGHRRENFGQAYTNFCEALIEIAKEDNVQIIFPVHLNPNVLVPVNKLLGNIKNITLISPVEYPVMVWLMQNCTVIISDSGGIQEEAPTFKKPIIVTRDVSERPEGVEFGFSKLVGTNKELIIESAKYYLNNNFTNNQSNPYGDGNACKKIVDFIVNLNWS